MPPLPPWRPAAVVSELNRRWATATASSKFAEAGVLMHVIDGDGFTGAGWVGGPPDINDPLRNIWQANPYSHAGDRLSASLVNSRHPDTYRCFLCEREWLYVPGLVLK